MIKQTKSSTHVITEMTCGNRSFLLKKAQQGRNKIENSNAIINGINISCAVCKIKNKAIKLTKVSDNFA